MMDLGVFCSLVFFFRVLPVVFCFFQCGFLVFVSFGV